MQGERRIGEINQVTWVMGTGLDQTLTIYGKIPQGANVPSNTYNDTITIIVAY